MADAIRQQELPYRSFGVPQASAVTAPRRASPPRPFLRARPAFTVVFALFAVVVALAATVYRATALSPTYNAETSAMAADACAP